MTKSRAKYTYGVSGCTRKGTAIEPTASRRTLQVARKEAKRRGGVLWRRRGSWGGWEILSRYGRCDR